MKKLILLLFTSLSFGQFQFGKYEYFTTSLAVDPSASIKEKGIDFNVQLELVSYWGYINANIQSFAALEGAYWDTTGAFGLNFMTDRFNTFRIYTGGRLGLIHRGGQTYPLAGFEGGFDVNLTDSCFVGIKATGDYRSDFEFWGGEPEIRYSGFVRVGYRWD